MPAGARACESPYLPNHERMEVRMSGWLTKVREHEQVTLAWSTRLAPVWEFDFDAIRDVANELGVRWPIRVGCAEYARNRKQGLHSCERDRAPHVITIGRTLDSADASRMLWHELTHAAQAERLGVDEFDRQYKAAGGHKGAGYRHNHFEREARAAEQLAHVTPLVNERRTHDTHRRAA
jgi:hypothetical protein